MYRSIVGKLMFFAQKIAPEMANIVQELSSHMDGPTEDHVIKLERAVGYAASNKEMPLVFRKPFS